MKTHSFEFLWRLAEIQKDANLSVIVRRNWGKLGWLHIGSWRVSIKPLLQLREPAKGQWSERNRGRERDIKCSNQNEKWSSGYFKQELIYHKNEWISSWVSGIQWVPRSAPKIIPPMSPCAHKSSPSSLLLRLPITPAYDTLSPAQHNLMEPCFLILQMLSSCPPPVSYLPSSLSPFLLFSFWGVGVGK